ncbi:MAG: SMC family ATPase [Akkermansiaceae bacterium]|nr:SMC family ATPase [Armatimonadota bacterium]
MSYGEGVPPLELAGVRLACLSGDNGNGKTALLDAITWALFDECRAKTKEDVIRLGANSCGVILEFLVDGTRYRIDRRISRKATGTSGGGSQWELQVRREDNSWHPLSGTTQRETQDKIVALLHMDYDTFLSTAYLAQGRADEFARSTPNKRKEVLADILDLSRYDRLEEMAKEREKGAKEKETDLTRTLAGIDATLANRDRYEMLLEDATRKLQTASGERDRLQRERHQIAIDVERLDIFEQRARNMEEKIAEAEERNSEDTATIDALLPRVAQAQTLMDRAGEIEAAYRRLQALQAEIGQLETVFNRALELGRKCGDLERVIRTEEGKLTNERYQKQCQIDEYERDVPTLTELQARIAQLKIDLQRFGDVEAALLQNEQVRQGWDDRMADLKDRNAAAKHAEAQLVKRLEALQSSSASNCEYCGEPLPPAKRAGAIAEAEAERVTIHARLAATVREANTVKQEIAALKGEQEGLFRSRQSKAEHDTQIRLYTQQVTRLEERVKLLPRTVLERDALEARLRDRDFLVAEQEQLAQLSAEREKAEAAHAPLEAARAEANALRNAPRDLDALNNAQAVLQTEPPRIAELQAKVIKRVGQIAVARQQVAKARTDSAELPALKQTLAEYDVLIAGASETVQRADREIGQWTSQLEYCRQQEQERVVYQAELLEAGKQRDLFRELAGAFGKKGVQALIIENALPDIVAHANELLAKLSNDAMQVELRTTREARTKGAANIETLDIIISDEMGTRPYEMFSGGEAFRVNFALRVALSRVLASRAGAPLQTLIVDEGFGTQDPRGREAITDALQAIQDHFALILCITHIEEIKEAFPTRIEVVKGTNGSTFTIA